MRGPHATTLNADSGLTVVIYQYDPQLDALFARAAAGVHAGAIESLTIGMGLRLSGWVGAHRRSIVNSEAALDLGNIAAQLRPSPQLCMSAPLIPDGKLVGVLTIYSTLERPFVAADVALLEMLATLSRRNSTPMRPTSRDRTSLRTPVSSVDSHRSGGQPLQHDNRLVVVCRAPRTETLRASCSWSPNASAEVASDDRASVMRPSRPNSSPTGLVASDTPSEYRTTQTGPPPV